MGFQKLVLFTFCFWIIQWNDAALGQQLHFTQAVYRATVNETFGLDYPRPSPGFLSILCTDSNTSNKSSITYNTDISSNPGPFMVNSSTGTIYSTADLDYENETSYEFTVTCSNLVNSSALATVEISVLPVNEFSPVVRIIGNTTTVKFENGPSAGDILISPTPGAGELYLEFSDKDGGTDGMVRFDMSVSVTPSELQSPFAINSTTGEVVYKTNPNADFPGTNHSHAVINLEIRVCDLSTNPRCYTSNSITVFLLLTDDNLPNFSQHNYTVSVYEEDASIVGTTLIQATCTDGDTGPGELRGVEIVNPSVQLSSLFVVSDPMTGTIILNHSLDYEKNRSIHFILRCSDTANNTDFANVTVNVKPRNDNRPIFTHRRYHFNISCNSGWTSQQSVGTVEAIDIDVGTGNKLTYSIVGNAFFDIDLYGRIFLQPSIQRAYGLFAFTVDVSDGEFFDSVPVMVSFMCDSELNRSLIFIPPGQQVHVVVLNVDTAVNTPILKLTCVATPSSLQLAISYSIISGNTEAALSIDSATGVLSVAKSLRTTNNESRNNHLLEVQCSANFETALISNTTTVSVQVVTPTPTPSIDSQIILISALGVVIALFFVFCLTLIIIATVYCCTKKKKKRLPSVEDPIVVPRRIILHTQSEVNLSDRRTIYPYHIAYRQPDSNDNKTNSGYEIMTGRGPVRLEQADESLPGTPNQARALTLFNVNNPTYIPLHIRAKHPMYEAATTPSPSGDSCKLPASESGYFESTQSQATEETHSAVEPSKQETESHPLSASLPALPADSSVIKCKHEASLDCSTANEEDSV